MFDLGQSHTFYRRILEDWQICYNGYIVSVKVRKTKANYFYNNRIFIIINAEDRYLESLNCEETKFWKHFLESVQTKADSKFFQAHLFKIGQHDQDIVQNEDPFVKDY